MNSKLEKQGSKWTCRYYISGKQKRKTFMAATYIEAQGEQTKFFSSLPKIQRKSTTFETFEAKILENANINCRPNTCKNYKIVLKHLKNFLAEKQIFYISDINFQILDEYKSRRKSEIKDTTLNLEIGLIKSIFNKAILWEYLIVSPARNLKLLKLPKTLPGCLDNDKVATILDSTSDDKVLGMFQIGFNTGFRFSEILNLKFSDIELKTETISVVPRNSFIPKDYEHRSLKIHPRLKEFFETSKLFLRRHSSDDYVFATKDGKRISAQSIYKKIRRAFRKAKIEGGHFHQCRHTFASNLVRNGANIFDVSKLLGHSTIKTTLRYAHLSPQSLNKTLTTYLDYSVDKLI
jgi:site-specific recombinase XerD